MTEQQVERIAECLAPNVPAIVSVFAGRVADTGRDPIPVMQASLRALAGRPKAELLWASPRELFNIFQADDIGCHIITVSHDVLAKLSLVGKDSNEYSLETVKMFYRDATAAGFASRPAAQGRILNRPIGRNSKNRARRRTNGNRFSRVFVTGGAGYVGSLLVPKLLDRGYKVTSYDISYFGDNFLPKSNPNLSIVQGDIRDAATAGQAVAGHDAFVSLACISNDASFELDEKLSTSINLDAFEPMVVAAKKAGIKRFVFASSSSVYGVSDQPDVTEDHPLVPLTLYNKYKGMCEPLLLKATRRQLHRRDVPSGDGLRLRAAASALIYRSTSSPTTP